MFQFQERYPELDAAAPLMDGETALPPTPLHSMRRQQLHDVARAWGIPVEDGGTKNDIMPMLLAAEKKGVFRLPPKHPEFARKAMRNSDEPPLAAVASVQVEAPDYRSMDMTQLSAACVAKGIDTDRRGGDYMITQLECSDGTGSPTA